VKKDRTGQIPLVFALSSDLLDSRSTVDCALELLAIFSAIPTSIEGVFLTTVVQYAG
jgi:hypothetical protein